jgi:RNA polymerase sigma factor (sigma-70 family)
MPDLGGYQAEQRPSGAGRRSGQVPHLADGAGAGAQGGQAGRVVGDVAAGVPQIGVADEVGVPPGARPWLYGIAANVIGKYRRAEVRMLRAFARTGADPVTDDYSDRIDSRVSAAAVQRDLAAALAGLPAGDRDVLLLIAWADLSYEETAAALRIPVGTVRPRLNRARRKVRKALGGQDPTSSNQEVPR